MTAKTKKSLIILGVGGAALAFWYFRQRGGSIGALFGGTSTGPIGTAQTPVLSQVSIDDPAIVKARTEATGPMSWKGSPPFPSRWINTVTGPYYGHSVSQSLFDRWIKLPSNVQGHATEDTYQQFIAGKLGV